jgi:hypothetical protein
MKTFEYEWILGAFDEHPTFFTKRMFGGLAAYLFERQMLLLVNPSRQLVAKVERHSQLRRFADPCAPQIDKQDQAAELFVALDCPYASEHAIGTGWNL